MLADRSYMRRESPTPQWSPTIALIVLNIVVYLIQATSPNLKDQISTYFALSKEGLSHCYVWQLLTFQFLHGGLPHLIINMFGIYIFGRPVEERLGKAAFLKLYLASGVLGGLLQAALAFALPVHFVGSTVGASAGVCGLVAAFALLDPNATLLLFFVLPVRAKYVLIGSIAISVGLIVTAGKPTPGEPGVAHAAHLGGFLGGIAYVRWSSWFPGAPAFWRRFQFGSRLKPRARPRELVNVRYPKASPWQRKKMQSKDVPQGDFISREVDPILDKISAHGLQSLTPEERKILEAAREKMERR
jgi:membrane associated rhomboid family serine protease